MILGCKRDVLFEKWPENLVKIKMMKYIYIYIYIHRQGRAGLS